MHSGTGREQSSPEERLSSLLSVVLGVNVASGTVLRPRACSPRSSAALGVVYCPRAIASQRTGVCFCLHQVALGMETSLLCMEPLLTLEWTMLRGFTERMTAEVFLPALVSCPHTPRQAEEDTIPRSNVREGPAGLSFGGSSGGLLRGCPGEGRRPCLIYVHEDTSVLCQGSLGTKPW